MPSKQWRIMATHLVYSNLWLPATARQKVAITRLCIALGVKEPIEELPLSKGEAGRIIRQMSKELSSGISGDMPRV